MSKYAERKLKNFNAYEVLKNINNDAYKASIA
jgi:hypothetical protein